MRGDEDYEALQHELEKVRGENISLRKILENTTDLVALIGRDKKFIAGTEPVMRRMGINIDSLKVNDFFSVFSQAPTGENLERMNKNFEYSLETGKPVVYDTTATIFGGHTLYFSQAFIPVKNRNGEIVDVIFHVRNMTELRKALGAAKQANEAKSSFLAKMSHEIRTPMNAVIGMAQIQLQNENLPDDCTNAFWKIYDSGSKLLGIINDILDMSKIETGKMELNPVDYDVPSLINDAVQLNIVHIGSKQIEFLIDVDENLPSRLYGDELRLRQILNNLISNAIKYTRKGNVKLSIRHSATGGAVGEAKGEDIILTFAIEDTGQGMNSEDVKKLFLEYSRFNTEANRATEGAGLGLNIAQSFAKLMGGTIEAKSEYGKGSTFTLTVKQKAVECEAIGAELAERLRNFTFSTDKQYSKLQITRTLMPYGNILVVDDVDTNLYVAEGLMAPYKLNIETANSGFTTIDKIQSGKVYDVIFMDHMMPEMDGIETTKKLRELGYAGTIVALTANAIVGNDKMFKENGLDDFISKPIDIRHLNAVLNKYVRDKHPEEAEKYKMYVETEQRDEISGLALVIEGINVESGLTRMGGRVKNYLQTLGVFHKDGIQKISQIKKCLETNDYPLYATYVHALKSASANVGAVRLPEDAGALESAAKRDDAAYINSHNAKFLSDLQELLENIGSVLETQALEAQNANKGEIDKEALKNLLLVLKEALNVLDYDMINKVSDGLQEFTQAAGIGGTVNSILENILIGEYDEVLPIIDSLLG